jgi:hypothetical protein
MKRLFVVLMTILLIGCTANKEFSFSEIKLDQANSKVKGFIDSVESMNEENGNGIYLMNDKKKRYVYVNGDFLSEGKYFGTFDVKTDENSINIYLTEDSVEDTTNLPYKKLYEINADQDYEYLRVFKNGEETHIQVIGA